MTKVDDIEIAILISDNVSGLQIPVDDASRMDLLHRLVDRPPVIRSFVHK
jgi:hypothetical protein